MIPFQFRPLGIGRWNHTTLRVATRFLTSIWAYDKNAYTFISTGIAGRWQDHPISGDRRQRIAEILTEFSPAIYNIYFCPNAFSKPHRQNMFALPSRYSWCDIDDNNPTAYRPAPNYLWQTSPGRHQGLWIWDGAARWEIAEQHSKSLVYEYGGDRNGWSITKLLRLPGTINHKPDYDAPHVLLMAFESSPQQIPRSLSRRRPIIKAYRAASVELTGIDALATMQKYRRAMGLEAGTLMMAKRVMRSDRSGAVFLIAAKMIEVGASDEEIAGVLLSNPYFVEKWGFDLDSAFRQIIKIRRNWEAQQ